MKRLAKLRNNKEVYSKEIKSLRKLLDDGEYTRVLPSGYHHFLSEMHRKLVGNVRITPKMLSAIEEAIESHGNYNNPEDRIHRDRMLAKITKLKYLLAQCGYTNQYAAEKMEFLDSITGRVHAKGKLTPKQAKYANQLYKQFSKRVLP
tara:strand:- start:567 stop:1010 length:444 start_codon:yes stop_codon:yes gene_type:complete